MPQQVQLIFTNGCFDVIHVGHIRLLEFAASLGHLVVGLNSDSSVKRLKGPNRPVNSEFDRSEVLRSIKYVKQVYIFEEDTPLRLINQLKPNIIVKGGDYSPSEVVGHGLADIRIFPLVHGVTTTSIISRINVD